MNVVRCSLVIVVLSFGENAWYHCYADYLVQMILLLVLLDCFVKRTVRIVSAVARVPIIVSVDL